MLSACPFVCPRAKLRSLPQGWPAAGLGTVPPSAKACTGGSANATSDAVAHGQPRFRPHLGHHTGTGTSTGYVSNNHSAVSHLLCPCSAAAGHCQDTAMSTTAEHFKPSWMPDGRSLLPRCVYPPSSGYFQESSLSCLHDGAVGPQHTQLPQGPPKGSRKHGPKSCCTDVLQKMTTGTKEQLGFTRTTPRSDSFLPALPGQPVSPSPT
ncbi:PPR32 phosphatase, partial [Balaeniceps rex]|nr:PPR32 phosphatase [Balaeniceps rex]